VAVLIVTHIRQIFYILASQFLKKGSRGAGEGRSGKQGGEKIQNYSWKDKLDFTNIL